MRARSDRLVARLVLSPTGSDLMPAGDPIGHVGQEEAAAAHRPTQASRDSRQDQDQDRQHVPPDVDPQVVANHFVPIVRGAVDYPLVASPAQFDDAAPTLSPAPGHGEHTDDVLAELGRSWDEIIELKASDAVL